MDISRKERALSKKMYSILLRYCCLLAEKKLALKIIFDKKSDVTAYTNGKQVVMNLANDIVNVKDDVDWMMLTKGMAAHEVAHCRYNDFAEDKRFMDKIQNFGFPYGKPKLDGYEKDIEEIQEFFSSSKYAKPAAAKVIHEIANIADDVLIEMLMSVDFPGLVKDNLFWLATRLYVTGKSVKEIEDSGNLNSIYDLNLNMLLFYWRFKTLKAENASEKAQKMIAEMQPIFNYVDENRFETSWEKRRHIYINLFIMLWKYNKDSLMSASESAEALEQFLESVKDMADMGTESPEGSGSSGSSPIEITKEALEKEFGELSGSIDKNNNSEDDSDESSGGNSSDEESEEDSADADKSEEKSDENSGEKSEEKSDKKSEGKSKEGNEEESEDKSKTAKNSKESESKSDDEPQHAEYTKRDIHIELTEINREVTRVKLDEQSEAKNLAERKAEISKMKFNAIHSGTDIVYRRNTDISQRMIDSYETESRDVKRVSKRLSRSLMSIIRENKISGKVNGLDYGPIFNGRESYRHDGRCFSRKIVPQESDIAIAVLLDESGSMYSGDKYRFTRTAARVLEDFGRTAEIPMLIAGHSTEGSRMAVYNYVEFNDKHNKNNKYRLSEVQARVQNRDGQAIAYMSQRLMSRPEDVKLLIVISDGQPADNGYYGSKADEDTKTTIDYYRKKGLKIFGAAIDGDKDVISTFYGDKYFMDITDMTVMPKTLVNLVKKHIKFK